MSFLDAYSQYLKYIDLNLKKQSVNSNIGKFKKHILPFFENYNIEDISKIDILNFKFYIDKKNLSFNSKRNIFCILSSFLNYCCDFLNLEKNYCYEIKNFRRKSERSKIMDFYSLDEFNIFINSFDNIVYKTFFSTMFFTGTRPGECMALKFSDIDFNLNYIDINKTIDEHGSREVSSPKSFSSYRKIIFDDYLKQELISLKDYYYSFYGCFTENFFVFGGHKPLSPTTINRYKIEACKKCNLRPIRLHDFRHSHATLLLNYDIPISEISERLGHSNISTTLNVYVHNNFSNKKRVFNTLNSLHNDLP